MVTGESSDPGDPVASILRFVGQYVALGESEQRLIRELTRVERYAKGTCLLAEGDVATESWLVIEGCVRVFKGTGDEARTLALHTELHLAIPPTYGTGAPSPVTLECLEAVVASASTPDEEARAFAEDPSFESVCRVMGDALRAHLQQAHIDAVTLTPEQRYLELVARRPDLLQRVPQYHVASLLGIQPETLSRIRRRLVRRVAPGR
ncbi:MAG: Crp/Fnr family transcriptional regulator [Polyangiaceae bacterium]|nr:Crp/Fnr family transcriptional regulator [Polyangiaceae bacterium]